MRSLTSISSATAIIPQIELTVTTGAGSAYVFTETDIFDMSDLRWQGKLGGGLGKVSDYDVTLYMALDTQKAILPSIPRSQVEIKVTVNSDSFQPHLGRVAGYERDADHLDRLTLTVADRIFYDNPVLPRPSIQDSYALPHPEELEANAGIPLYYGDESNRDVYFTAVDSIVQDFLGPENVSSESHLGRIYYNSNLDDPSSLNGNYLYTGYHWNQQSGSDNIATDVFSEWVRRDDVPWTTNLLKQINSTSHNLFFIFDWNTHPHTADIAYVSPGVTGWKKVSFPASLSGTTQLNGFIHNGSHYLVCMKTGQPGYFVVGCSTNPLDFFDCDIFVSSLSGDTGQPLKMMGPYIMMHGRNFEFTVSTDGLNWNTYSSEHHGIEGAADYVWVGSLGASFQSNAFYVFGDVRSATPIRRTDTGKPPSGAWLTVSHTFPSTPLNDGPRAAAGNGRIVAIDRLGNVEVNTNGSTFNRTITASHTSIVTWQDIIFDGSYFLTIGNETGGLTLLGQSEDGVTWQYLDVGTRLGGGAQGGFDALKIRNTPVGTKIIPGARTISNQYRPGLAHNGPLYLAEYERNSVFTSPTSNRIAISTNPLAILDHINSHHLNYPYHQDQSSDSQADISSFSFNCYFGDREPVQDILQEFGQTTGVNLWFGDSGMIHYRTYQESGTATVNRTLIPEADLKISERVSPIGSPLNSSLSSRFRFAYNYHFQRKKYEGVLTITSSNNTSCASLEAAGQKTEQQYTSKYIMVADVASLWAVNRIRIETQPTRLIELELPGRYMETELFDVWRIQSQMFPGSETTAQVVDLRFDLLRGRVRATLEELKAYVA